VLLRIPNPQPNPRILPKSVRAKMDWCMVYIDPYCNFVVKYQCLWSLHCNITPESICTGLSQLYTSINSAVKV